MIITYHRRIKQEGQRRNRRCASRAKDGIPYDRACLYGWSYGVPSPPPDQLFPPREIGSWIRHTERPETHLEGRTLASGVHPEDGLAWRRGGSSSSRTRGLQHHHHCIVIIIHTTVIIIIIIIIIIHILIIVTSRTLVDHLVCYLNHSSMYAITLVMMFVVSMCE
jgi:hypothetical protein